MIYSLSGIIIEKTVAEVVIECGGVGYLVGIPSTVAGALPATGEKATIYTYMNVTENDVALFGFATKSEREMFCLVTSVSGVGPKVGLAILSVLSPQNIVLAISSGDHKAFTAANGVGPKLGQRIVLELKDKVNSGIKTSSIEMGDILPQGSLLQSTQQAVAALVSLGYSQSEAASAVAKQNQTLPLAEIIRLALQGIGGKS